MKNAKFTTVCLIVLALFICSAVIGCGGQKAAEKSQAAKTVLRLNGAFPVQHPLSKAVEVFKKEVEKTSKGTMEVRFYPAGQLYVDKDMTNVLPKGGVEMAEISPDWWSGIAPSVMLFNALGYFENYDHMWRAVEGEPGKIINKEFEDKGNVKIVTWLDYGDIELISKKPIKSADDLQGLRIRSFGEGSSLWIQAVGGAPVSMASAECYQALQRGTVDGSISGVTSFFERKWFEVAKHYTKAPVSHTVHAIVINLDVWKKLTPEQQKIVMDAGKEARKYNASVWAEEDKKAQDSMNKAGATQNVISAAEQAKWREKVVPAFIKNMNDKYGVEKTKKLLDAAEALRKK
jgi:TRAP-type C4-dicarboxylate transport system substrate-binding protein